MVISARERYIGKKFKVKCGWTCEVIEYNGANDLTIRWEECGSVESGIRSGSLNTGFVRPKMIPSIVGVGINDLARSEYNKDYYWKWTSMIKRAYCRRYHKAKPTYKDVEVCDEWKLFSNFHKWCEGWGDVKELELDKDYKGCGKIYSPDNCMFVPRYVNGFIMGVPEMVDMKFTWKARLNKYEVAASSQGFGGKDYIGIYSTKEESIAAYIAAKKNIMENILDKYRKELIYREDVEKAIRDWAYRKLVQWHT